MRIKNRNKSMKLSKNIFLKIYQNKKKRKIKETFKNP